MGTLVGQLPQTSYHSLLTPYAFFGLGRTNNYIENLFVGSTKHTAQHFINMEGVIPNSKVVILPPASSDEGAAWKRELYLRPGSWIPWVTVTVVVATILLAVIVFVLHLNEKVSVVDNRCLYCTGSDHFCVLRGKMSWSGGGHPTILISMHFSTSKIRLGSPGITLHLPIISLDFMIYSEHIMTSEISYFVADIIGHLSFTEPHVMIQHTFRPIFILPAPTARPFLPRRYA